VCGNFCHSNSRDMSQQPGVAGVTSSQAVVTTENSSTPIIYSRDRLNRYSLIIKNLTLM
jgi:hypothetical protein